jgi:multiple sugar transport system permease protein
VSYGPITALSVRLRAGRQRSSHSDRGTALLVPAVVLTGAIVVGPFLFTILMAFNSDAGVRGPQGDWGLENLQRMFSDPLAWQALRVTAFLFAVCLVIETVLGLMIALVLQHKVPGRRVLEALVLIPSITASVAVAMMWLLLMQPRIGRLNAMLAAMGIQGPSWLGDPNVAPWAIVLVDVWQWTPFMALILVAGLRGLPEEPLEAALVDGASGLQRFSLVILPMLWPVILVAVLLRSIDLLRFFDTVYILTQGGPINATLTLNVYGYRQGFNFLRLGYAAMLQLTLLIIVVVFAVLITRLQKRASDAV